MDFERKEELRDPALIPVLPIRRTEQENIDVEIEINFYGMPGDLQDRLYLRLSATALRNLARDLDSLVAIIGVRQGRPQWH
jgi:hypothetical protein